MNIKKAQNLLRLDMKTMTLEQIQKYKIDVLDALRHSEAYFGELEAIRRGFYIPVASESASGYVPKDLWLSHNLKTRYNEAVALEAEIFKE